MFMFKMKENKRRETQKLKLCFKKICVLYLSGLKQLPSNTDRVHVFRMEQVNEIRQTVKPNLILRACYRRG